MSVTPDTSRNLLDEAAILSSGSALQIRRWVHSLYPAETAHILESIEPELRLKVWGVVPATVKAEVLLKLNIAVGSAMLKLTDRQELLEAIELMGSDHMIDLLHVLPEPLLSQVLESIGVHKRQDYERTLVYDDDTAGALMQHDVVVIRADVSLDVVARYLRIRGVLPQNIDSLIVVDRNEHYQGQLALSHLLTRDPGRKVSDVMDKGIAGVSCRMKSRDLVALFQRRPVQNLPVLDEHGKVLGRISLERMLGLIRHEADHSLMSMAGLAEDQDIFEPVVDSAKRRAVWLGINLLTAFLAAAVIDLFEATIQQIVVLAVLMPIVASMGGIAGSQTLTLVVRGLALGQVSALNSHKLLNKEVLVGFMNGLIWAVVVSIVAGVWFHNFSISMLLGAAMIINLACAAAAGVLIPVALDKMGVDPALAGGVLLTTVTDVVGFMAFLGLATLFLL